MRVEELYTARERSGAHKIPTVRHKRNRANIDTKLPVLSRYSLVGIRELLAAESAPGVVSIILPLVPLLVDCPRMLGL
jgi:hypothetical protein